LCIDPDVVLHAQPGIVLSLDARPAAWKTRFLLDLLGKAAEDLVGSSEEPKVMLWAGGGSWANPSPARSSFESRWKAMTGAERAAVARGCMDGVARVAKAIRERRAPVLRLRKEAWTAAVGRTVDGLAEVLGAHTYRTCWPGSR
jgi:hypothetical protein